MLETLVQQLAKELDMDQEFIVPKEQGAFTLFFDNQIQVDISSFSQSYLFKGLIGKFPKNKGEDFLVKTMEANLFGRGTRGAIIGLNREENLLTLSLELDYNSPYKDFKDKLEDFVNVLDFWRQEALKY